jgi:hypothetical protein
MITRREFVIGIAGVTVAGAFAEQQGEERLIASCGIYCGACSMYIVTQSKDEAKIKALMKQYGKADAPIEDMLCDGCLGGGRLAVHCRKCEYRDCASKKAPKSKVCSDCPDLACDRITKFNNDGIPHHAEALSNLRQARSMGLKQWAKLEKEKWSCPKCKSPIAWFDAACPKCGEKRSDRLFPLKRA